MTEQHGRPRGGVALGAVAGEASGDALFAPVLAHLHALRPEWTAAGVGGPRMVAQGFEAWESSDALSVRGYVEVLRHLPRLLRLRRTVAERFIRERPQLFVGVDAPDFNLGLEAQLKAAGIPTAHFISPSVWAWRRERVWRMARSAQLVLCVFPMEPPFYEGTGVRAVYVGHPLADAIPLRDDAQDRAAQRLARQALGLDSDRLTLALLPGSRMAEITHLLAVFLRAAHTLQHRHGLQIVLPVAGVWLRKAVEQIIAAQQRSLSGANRLTLMLVEGRSHEVMTACDLALVASGTATLELALFKRPMVIAYAMPRLSWWWLRGRNQLPWIGLPNILLGDSVVPELVQDDLHETALVNAAQAWLDDAARRSALRERLTALHEQLRCDAARRAAEALVELVG